MGKICHWLGYCWCSSFFLYLFYRGNVHIHKPSTFVYIGLVIVATGLFALFEAIYGPFWQRKIHILMLIGESEPIEQLVPGLINEQSGYGIRALSDYFVTSRESLCRHDIARYGR
ncbi:hypothetical protein ID852_00450 [Xenorhabdus sp. 42]|uniref:Uncharacterized protein n=1 Tax=Xenorhabdus szentirmaii DSM 16338 TaxID=1427518 RepID=W1J2E0_9GAMM|nr:MULTISPECIES: hypothetical protein [unclassified Xenorhabdus]MBD2819187.1 hypothetical protein [Xenorhabdus sp. 42]CDL84243.1 hypothetical protein XSR1_420009 [Xenorhabdus szentirmaii DSM 16338]